MGFGDQGNRRSRRNRPGRNNRRPGRRPRTRPGAPGGGGGGLFSKIGQGFKNVTSSVGKGLKSAAGSVGKFAAKANPLNVLKKALTSNAGKFIGKAAKGGLIGALLNAGNLAAILAGEGSPQQKAEQIIPLATGILGGTLGSIAGSIVPVVGTFGGGLLGGIIGDWIGNLPAVQKALAPPLAKVLGGDDVAEDFIMQGGKIQRFRKDDIVMGGTKLTGSDPKSIQLLERLVSAVEKGSVVMLDGQKVGQALNVGARRLQ
jgi:phage tail tape-measure protein